MNQEQHPKQTFNPRNPDFQINLPGEPMPSDRGDEQSLSPEAYTEQLIERVTDNARGTVEFVLQHPDGTLEGSGRTPYVSLYRSGIHRLHEDAPDNEDNTPTESIAFERNGELTLVRYDAVPANNNSADRATLAFFVDTELAGALRDAITSNPNIAGDTIASLVEATGNDYEAWNAKIDAALGIEPSPLKVVEFGVNQRSERTKQTSEVSYDESAVRQPEQKPLPSPKPAHELITEAIEKARAEQSARQAVESAQQARREGDTNTQNSPEDTGSGNRDDDLDDTRALDSYQPNNNQHIDRRSVYNPDFWAGNATPPARSTSRKVKYFFSGKNEMSQPTEYRTEKQPRVGKKVTNRLTGQHPLNGSKTYGSDRRGVSVEQTYRNNGKGAIRVKRTTRNQNDVGAWTKLMRIARGEAGSKSSRFITNEGDLPEIWRRDNLASGNTEIAYDSLVKFKDAVNAAWRGERAMPFSRAIGGFAQFHDSGYDISNTSWTEGSKRYTVAHLSNGSSEKWRVIVSEGEAVEDTEMSTDDLLERFGRMNGYTTQDNPETAPEPERPSNHEDETEPNQPTTQPQEPRRRTRTQEDPAAANPVPENDPSTFVAPIPEGLENTDFDNPPTSIEGPHSGNSEQKPASETEPDIVDGEIIEDKPTIEAAQSDKSYDADDESERSTPEVNSDEWREQYDRGLQELMNSLRRDSTLVNQETEYDIRPNAIMKHYFDGNEAMSQAAINELMARGIIDPTKKTIIWKNIPN